MFKKASNLWFKCRIFILLSYVLFVILPFRVRKHRFRFEHPRNKSKKRKRPKRPIKNKYKQLEILFKLIYSVFRSYLKLLKYCIRHIQEFSVISFNCGRAPIGAILSKIIGFAWFFEKLQINIMPSKQNIFDNSEFKNLNKPKEMINSSLFVGFAKGVISSECGNKIISKMAIKKELQQKADEWVYSNLQGDWIAVHYRGTDVMRSGRRYRCMAIKGYITYLKGVLGDHCNIFACSDQAQFIEQMQVAFPGRVFSTDITRSRDNTPLHRGRDSVYKGEQQKEDALIDLLVLSKASLVYTTGSYFVDMARFLNPSIKIVSVDGREVCYKGIPNYLPSPKL